MTTQVRESLGKLLDFIDELKALKLWYRLDKVRDAIMIQVAVPGERWEIEFFEDGHVELERFHSDGEIDDEHGLRAILARYADDLNDTDTQ